MADEETGLSPGQKRLHEDLAKYSGSRNRIFLRSEVISAQESRAATSVSRIFTTIATAALIADLVEKFRKPGEFFLQNQWPLLNIAYAAFCLIPLLPTLVFFCWRLRSTVRSGKRWSWRRRVASASSLVILIATTIGNLFWLIPNAWILGQDCAWFEPLVLWGSYVMWTSYNVNLFIFLVQAHNLIPWDPPANADVEPQESYCNVDRPLTIHIWKGLLWLAFQAVLTALGVYAQEAHIVGLDNPPGFAPSFAIRDARCPKVSSVDCTFDTTSKALTVTTMGALLVYCLLWAWYMLQARSQLYRRSYHKYRTPNLVMRVYRRSRAWAMGTFAISIVLIFYARIDSCASYVETWLGLAPVQFIMTGLALVGAFLTMPTSPDRSPVALQTLLEQFAWLEADKQSLIDARNFGHSPAVAEQPLFCFETCIKLFYWSNVVYAIQEDWDGADMETAMRLYDLQHYELLWEPAEDTKCLFSWSRTKIVVAFRGTASLSNVLADLQAWTTHLDAHMPHKVVSTRSRAAVHSGFLKSWRANDLHMKVVRKVQAIIDSPHVDEERVQIYVTGHSLGGALATLAAMELRKQIPGLQWRDVICYTFGAPRTGNHAFAREFNKLVPDTWGLINDQDAVARGGKFLTLYKRPGQRVIINHFGDLIVRPGFAEASFQRVLFGSSVSHHFLASYRRSLAHVCVAQFHNKGFPHGSTGIQRLMTSGSGKLVLGPELRRLQKLQRAGTHLRNDVSDAVKALEQAVLEDAHIAILRDSPQLGDVDEEKAAEAEQDSQALGAFAADGEELNAGAHAGAEPDAGQARDSIAQGHGPCSSSLASLSHLIEASGSVPDLHYQHSSSTASHAPAPSWGAASVSPDEHADASAAPPALRGHAQNGAAASQPQDHPAERPTRRTGDSASPSAAAEDFAPSLPNGADRQGGVQGDSDRREEGRSGGRKLGTSAVWQVDAGELHDVASDPWDQHSDRHRNRLSRPHRWGGGMWTLWGLWT